jgi:ABC-2 type transport system ATP-binding protein
VLLSAHILGDVAQTVDRVVVISRGRLVADGPITEPAGEDRAVRVKSPQAARLAELLRTGGATVGHDGYGGLLVAGAERERIGEVAAHGGIVLHELVSQQASLDEVFFALSKSAGVGLR